MEDKINRVKVNIAGEEYTIRGDAESATITEISDYINRKLTELGGGVSSKDKYKTAVLAAVNITGELFQTRQELEKVSQQLDSFVFKAKELSEKIEHAIV